ncbi:sugar transporter sugar binding lipoprotein (plasmid) [Streptantibioticus cattleyicolor NRRL 8057 = DSM 46488]|uniref:Sugar transporter sugar binding lipoprotein n=1 Tax=Streptantibioticus cattleyicolor (strain ATCC 35852 / DSM 46488 / JCM 4925 / NBRC 14057 / NRRL 8057) TaxID=1003195 RepID=G8XFM4_STREN|nr:sugar transporter sugar binding lipoprotein [Streptantibioticus cattleyicolor NRRL 8057 = DSM 46488]
MLRLGASAAVAAGLTATVSGCSAAMDDGVGPDGRVTIELWHGQVDSSKVAVEAMVREFNRTHPKIRVDAGGGGAVADDMLQKVTAALAAGAYPDVAYIYGSDLPNIARSPQVVDLTSWTGHGATPWQQYWPAAREAVTVNKHVRALPALIDSLAVVYNKKLFRQAGVPYPKAGWTWDEFVETARRLTDPGHGVFGTGWPGAGDEDTTWRLWPMIWDLGGEIVGPDGRSIGFADQGVRALQTLADLTRDHCVYIDSKPGGELMYQVFTGGRLAMVATGPWKLPDIIDAKVDYGVVPLPTYSGRPLTISGPDTWTIFDNGPARSRAAKEFVSWLIQPDQDVRLDLTAGTLPLSRISAARPAWLREVERTTGLEVFTKALDTARVRPVIPAYPQISQALGQAIISVLIGSRTPAQAIRACASTANAALRIPR